MSEKRGGGPFSAAFNYTEEVLGDFEALYTQKKEISLPIRIAFGVLGAVGAVYFGYMLYKEGLQLARVGYELICGAMLVLALGSGKRRPDDSVAKYRKAYTGKNAEFTIDENGVEMHLEGQKSFARSKFKEIYALYDTDLCFYFVIKGKAYYILPRASLEDDEAVKKYMEKKCMKRFVHYEVKQESGR